MVSRDDPSFGGTILINPGGPGGSGVEQVLGEGRVMRDMIIDSPDKHFEILSWDPRGLHHTTPQIACFQTGWDRDIWMHRNWAVGQLGTSQGSLDMKWALYESLVKVCAQSAQDQYNDGSNIHGFVSTALTAHDMIAIIDALQEEHTSLVNHQKKEDGLQHPLLKKNELALLQYWGFSYGTSLGNTFASMFPHRVGRMILDGNVDAQDYVNTGWLSNLHDTPKTLHWFYCACFHAGTRCGLYDSNTTSLFDIESRTNNVLEQLSHNPLAIVHNGAADLVTYADVTNVMFNGAYAPIYLWPELAQIIHDLSQHNGSSIVKYLRYPRLPQGLKPFILENSSVTQMGNVQPYFSGYGSGSEFEGGIAVYCGDGKPIHYMTKQDWKEHILYLQNQSVIAGSFWAENPFACQHWSSSLRPADRNRFIGPFGSRLKDYDRCGSPLLFIGNTADPVTPLRNAIGNSKTHEGSVVLVQDTRGHCSGHTNPSRCTFQVIRAFFNNGTLPDVGKICTGDQGPWDKPW